MGRRRQAGDGRPRNLGDREEGNEKTKGVGAGPAGFLGREIGGKDKEGGGVATQKSGGEGKREMKGARGGEGKRERRRRLGDGGGPTG